MTFRASGSDNMWPGSLSIRNVILSGLYQFCEQDFALKNWFCIEREKQSFTDPTSLAGRVCKRSPHGVWGYKRERMSCPVCLSLFSVQVAVLPDGIHAEGYTLADVRVAVHFQT
jgi:hypothetical protein